VFVIDDIIVSESVITEKFLCDLSDCKGACCVEGDAGAPIEESEIGIMEDLADAALPYATEKGQDAIKSHGVFDFDENGEFVTPLVNHEECAFVYFEDGVAKCAIEKAFEKGETAGLSDDDDFNKPISCYLYPIREVQLKGAIALNYHEWDVCKLAVEKGEKENLPIYKFLKKPLIRRFGSEWYDKLCKAVDEYYAEK